jgi:hypothetical protein
MQKPRKQSGKCSRIAEYDNVKLIVRAVFPTARLPFPEIDDAA